MSKNSSWALSLTLVTNDVLVKCMGIRFRAILLPVDDWNGRKGRKTHLLQVYFIVSYTAIRYPVCDRVKHYHQGHKMSQDIVVYVDSKVPQLI